MFVSLKTPKYFEYVYVMQISIESLCLEESYPGDYKEDTADKKDTASLGGVALSLLGLFVCHLK